MALSVAPPPHARGARRLLSVSVPHDVVVRLDFGGSGRGEAAFCHSAVSHSDAPRALPTREGATVMHVFTHTFDYIALGILIACMLGAAARVLQNR